MYAATTGTFLQRDPLGLPSDGVIGYSHEAVTHVMSARKVRSRRMSQAASNLYEYAGSNPVDHVDPFGLDPFLYWGDGNNLEIAPGQFTPIIPPGLSKDEQALLAASRDANTYRAALQIIEALHNYKSKAPPGFRIGLPDQGYCHAWVAGGILRQLEDLIKPSGGGIRSVKYLIPPYTGWIPIFFDHGVIQVTMANGVIIYIDNEWKGGSDNIFFQWPSDLTHPNNVGPRTEADPWANPFSGMYYLSPF